MANIEIKVIGELKKESIICMPLDSVIILPCIYLPMEVQSNDVCMLHLTNYFYLNFDHRRFLLVDPHFQSQSALTLYWRVIS